MTCLNFGRFQVLSFLLPHHLLLGFEFLTSPLNKRCGHPHGERNVEDRAKIEGREGAGEAEGKTLSLNTLSHLSPKNPVLCAQ